MRKIYTLTAVFLLLSCGKNDRLEVVAFKTPGGYGYRITDNGKTLVKQKTIPAIAGNKVFCSSTDAVSTGKEVLKKIRNHESPAISVNDLKTLNINTNCSGELK